MERLMEKVQKGKTRTSEFNEEHINFLNTQYNYNSKIYSKG